MKNIIAITLALIFSASAFAGAVENKIKAVSASMGTSGGGNPAFTRIDENAMGTGGGGTPPALTTEIDELLSEVNAVDLEKDLLKKPLEKTILSKDLEAIISAGLNKRPLPLSTKDGKLIELSPDKFVFEKDRLMIPVGARTMILYKAAEEN